MIKLKIKVQKSKLSLQSENCIIIIIVLVIGRSGLKHPPPHQLRPPDRSLVPLRQDKTALAPGNCPSGRGYGCACHDRLANLHMVLTRTDVRSLVGLLQSVEERPLWHSLHSGCSFLHRIYLHLWLLRRHTSHWYRIHEHLQRI